MPIRPEKKDFIVTSRKERGRSSRPVKNVTCELAHRKRMTVTETQRKTAKLNARCSARGVLDAIYSMPCNERNGRGPAACIWRAGLCRGYPCTSTMDIVQAGNDTAFLYPSLQARQCSETCFVCAHDATEDWRVNERGPISLKHRGFSKSAQ
jgi:hypothetical protein